MYETEHCEPNLIFQGGPLKLRESAGSKRCNHGDRADDAVFSSDANILYYN